MRPKLHFGSIFYCLLRKKGEGQKQQERVKRLKIAVLLFLKEQRSVRRKLSSSAHGRHCCKMLKILLRTVFGCM